MWFQRPNIIDERLFSCASKNRHRAASTQPAEGRRADPAAPPPGGGSRRHVAVQELDGALRESLVVRSRSLARADGPDRPLQVNFDKIWDGMQPQLLSLVSGVPQTLTNDVWMDMYSCVDRCSAFKERADE